MDMKLATLKARLRPYDSLSLLTYRPIGRRACRLQRETDALGNVAYHARGGTKNPLRRLTSRK
jgi:hypothetical protein